MTQSLKIGAVSYLNTKPLVYGLQQRLPEAEITFDLPGRLADDLARGELDIALIPTVETFDSPGYQILSDACIACRGPVHSVSLVSRCASGEIRTLALDEGSRTSVALVQVLLKKRLGIRPELQDFPIGQSLQDCQADAVLIIGDRAMHVPADEYEEIWDLGEHWVDWTGLPFVFAMWTARAGIEQDLSEVEQAFSTARDAGLANLEKIATAHADDLGLSAEQCLTYLRDHLHFYLGDAERQSMDLFRGYVGELFPAAKSIESL